jgi:hypothetical protein
MAGVMELMSRVAMGLVGVQVGILGVIIVAGSSEVSKQSGILVFVGFLVWVVGFLFILGAYQSSEGSSERETTKAPWGPTS